MLTPPRPDPGRGWSLTNAVCAGYALFLAGFFVVPNAVDLYKFYIYLVLVPGLFLLPRVLGPAWASPLWRLLLAYFGYMLLTSLWSAEFSAAELWRDVFRAACILGFMLLTAYYFSLSPALQDWLLRVIALVAVLSAATAIVALPELSLPPALPEQRLAGPGIANNPNPAAFIYGAITLVVLDSATRQRGWLAAGGHAIGIAVLLLFIVLTQSNTGLLALLLAGALLLLVDRHLTWPKLVTALLLGGVALLFLAWSLGWLNGVLDAGLAQRFPIWEYILEQWRAAPVFGNGLQRPATPAGDQQAHLLSYAHSLFLATLRDGGAVGLALLLGVWGYALHTAARVARREQRPLYLCMLVFGLLCMLVDTDQAITRPRENWIMLWLPLACLLAYTPGLPDGASAGGAPKKIW